MAHGSTGLSVLVSCGGGTRVRVFHGKRALERAFPVFSRGTQVAQEATMLVRTLCVLAMLVLPGCYGSHERAPELDETCDALLRPVCVHRQDPCAPAIRVAPTCVEDEWRCVDSSPYAPTWGGTSCLPFMAEGALGLVAEAPLPVPVTGRCRWLFGHVEDAAGDELRNVMVDVPETCDALEWPAAPTSAVEMSPDVDIVSAQAAFIDGEGDTRLLVRGWAWEAGAPFGIADRGVDLARMRGERAALSGAWIFDPSMDLGDAALVWEGHAYAYGCPGAPAWIEEDCFVARAPLERIDDAASWAHFDGSTWSGGEPARVFASGPHRGPVFADPRGVGFVHLYSVGFGTRIELTRAARPEGPWSAASTLVECELPEDDEGAYCAGPSVHLELWDPTQPSVLWIGYSVGTTSADGDARRAANPAAYWTRLVRVTLR